MKRNKYIHVQVGRRLRLVRGNLSQREFARRIGVPFRTYQRYEAGETLPSGQALNNISQRTGKPIDWILQGDRAGEPSTYSYGAGETSMDKRSQERLKRILREGDRNKIDLIRALLRVLDPGECDKAE